VGLPAIPIDSLMHFYMLCLALGEEPFSTNECVISPELGTEALQLLRELVLLCDPANLERNPIRTYEAMVGSDTIAYCPFAYGYVNYAQAAYTARPLRFGGLVQFGGQALRSTLGGTGLAIAQGCNEREAALAYAQFVANPACQQGMYVECGGQPGHRSAWEHPAINQRCGGFFQDTLATLDAAYPRPRYSGYIPFQDHASLLVHSYLRDSGDARATIAAINELYRKSRTDTDTGR
jgi:multiple sugar transport system substrate-binding protein